jgi:signal transduction histidine kinase
VLDRADGTARLVTASAVPLRNGDEQLTGAVLMLVDLSELRAAAALEKEVLGMVTHDMRNPLAAVRMLAQQLDRAPELSDERRHDLAGRMLVSIKRMEALLGALTDYTRARSGAALRLHRSPVDLAALTRRVMAEHEESFPGRRCELEAVGDACGWWDEARLEQIVANLVSNGLRHGALEGSVTLRIDGRRSSAVELVVRNDGPAISAELLPRLFDPFKPEHRSPGRGLGLGLFIVKHLVEAHGGAITVRSADGEGTAFDVVLPRESA